MIKLRLSPVNYRTPGPGLYKGSRKQGDTVWITGAYWLAVWALVELVSSTSEVREETTDLHAQNSTTLSPSAKKASTLSWGKCWAERPGRKWKWLASVTVSLESCQSPGSTLVRERWQWCRCWTDGILALVFLSSLVVTGLQASPHNHNP